MPKTVCETINGMTFTYRRGDNGELLCAVTYGDVVIAAEHPIIMDREEREKRIGWRLRSA